jgi:hypothetical protein
MAALCVPISSGSLDASLEEESRSLPGEELGWQSYGRLRSSLCLGKESGEPVHIARDELFV